MAGYNVPEAKCTVCQKEHSDYKTDDIDSSSMKPFKLSPAPVKGDHFYYGVRIVTGSEVGSGTPDSDVYATLVGSKASTGKIPLAKWFSAKIATKSYLDLVIEVNTDLGEVLVVILGNPKNWLFSAGSAWFVDFVVVIDQQTKREAEFPCYHWINDGDYISFTSKTAILKDVMGNSILVHQRQTSVDQRKQKYNWQVFPDIGLPSSIDVSSKNLSNDEQFGAVKTINFTKEAITAGSSLLFTVPFTNVESLSDYEKLAAAIKKPEFPTYEISRWTRDVEFGRQMLNGVNPIVIKRCTALPDNFPVTNEMVKGSMDRNSDLVDEMKAGHVYICDLKIMDGLPCQKGYYCSAPLCLLYVNRSDQLVPIAIQLKQQPGGDNPIFLPSDNWADWTLAKMYYQSAHFQFHQLATHYLSCHAAMETYGMGVMRNLPDAHPVYKLLRPHFRYTMAINAQARESLINDGGILDQQFAIGGEGRREFMRRAGRDYSIHWANVPRSANERKVDDAKLLPGYYYRDDGLKIWNALEHFVNQIIAEFYSSDADVSGDIELQNFAEDVHTNGFPANKGEKGHGFPMKIKRRAELVELCTLIMFTGSAQHSSVNFGQYDIYNYVPNATPAMRLPLPAQKGNADAATLVQALPDKKACSSVIGMVYMLSQYSKDELYLGDFPFEYFTEEKAQDYIKTFRKALNILDADIVERNKVLDVPYVYLQPSRVTKSITI